MGGSAKHSAALLVAKFFVLAPICLVIWLLLLPVYAHVLGYAAAAVYRYGLGYNIMGIRINTAGFLNTDTALTFVRLDGESTMPGLGHLVGNVAPFVALVLATPRLRLRRRLGVISIGVALIFLSHLATLVIRPMGRGPIQAAQTPLTTVVGFFSITLPFLLWIVLAYWGQLMAFLGEGPVKEAKSEKPGA